MKPWHKSAPNLLVVNTILAAGAALVVQTLVTIGGRHCLVWILFAVAALFLFILSAEKIAEAFSDDDLDLYIKYFLSYNIAVLLLFLSVVGIVRIYGELSAGWTAAGLLVSVILWFWGWGCDTLFVIFRDNIHFPRWKGRLNGDLVEKPLDHCDRLCHRIDPYMSGVCSRIRRLLR